jgi:hypothetical protein
MAWTTEIPLIVRTLINDLSDQPVYTDERLQQIIVVAAKYVQIDVSFDNEYKINITDLTITPDPVDIQDEIFSGLLGLKAACLVDHSTLRTKAATEGIRAALGPSMISVNGSLEGIRLIMQAGPCATYDELVSHWNVSQATFVRAVLGPFVGNKFDPRSLFSDNRGRDLY